VTEVETALERELSEGIMKGGSKPTIRKLAEGETLTEQGEEATDLYLLLDGVLSVEVDGQPLADVGPGAILGERALLEDGRRTSTLRAATRCKVAVFTAVGIDESALAKVARGHRREEAL
jgi:CRP-like cAMP-binding protein